VRFAVSSLTNPGRTIDVDGLVDTGASFPFIPESLMHSLGIVPTAEKEFLLADGSKKSYRIGELRISFNGFSAPCLAVFSLDGTEPLFGALALEILGLEVDPVNRRLKPATLFLA